MILVLQVDLVSGYYAEGEWSGVLEIEADSTLEDLHFAIQSAVKFDCEHLYEFFIGRTSYSRKKIRFDDENGEVYERVVADLFPLPKNKSLFYYFDYGDSWIFKIKKKKIYQSDKADCDYPRLVSEAGTKPVQYPIENGWD